MQTDFYRYVECVTRSFMNNMFRTKREQNENYLLFKCRMTINFMNICTNFKKVLSSIYYSLSQSFVS